MKVPIAVIIIAWGLTRAARLTATTLMPKKMATSATPSSAPIRPLVPPSTVHSTTMTAAAAAVKTADRLRTRPSSDASR